MITKCILCNLYALYFYESHVKLDILSVITQESIDDSVPLKSVIGINISQTMLIFRHRMQR